MFDTNYHTSNPKTTKTQTLQNPKITPKTTPNTQKMSKHT